MLKSLFVALMASTALTTNPADAPATEDEALLKKAAPVEQQAVEQTNELASCPECNVIDPASPADETSVN